MCKQCLANAVVIKGNIVPGFTLMKATTFTDGWAAGQYGLVESDDPTFIFSGPILADPLAGIPGDELVKIPSEDPRWSKSLDHMCYAGSIMQNFNTDPVTGWRLVQACILAGFNPQDDGDVMYWLVNHMATQLPEAQTA